MQKDARSNSGLSIAYRRLTRLIRSMYNYMQKSDNTSVARLGELRQFFCRPVADLKGPSRLQHPFGRRTDAVTHGHVS